MTTPQLRNSINRSPLPRDLLLIPLLLVCLALSSAARAGSPTNVSLGLHSLPNNTTGANNTAIGFGALSVNTSGYFNTAVGSDALRFNTTGFYNAALGGGALAANTTGGFNTAVGEAALEHNTTGSDNIALGALAGQFLTTGDFNIYIGNKGVAAESATIRIGDSDQIRTFIAGISGTAVTGSPVVVGATGQLGVAASSARFKDEIKPMDKASDAILALRPVTFHYKKELDPGCIPQFGLVAEEVAKVSPDLVARDAKGKPYTVRYEAVNAMLLNEFLKEHRKVETQDKKLQQLETIVAQLKTALKEQAAQIQKVSAQLEVSKPVPQMVVNNQ